MNIKKNGLSSNALKLYAVIAMFLEHVSVFVPQDTFVFFIMRLLGRSAAPIFFYFVVEGYHHTQNKNRYTLNLALFAVISYIPFILCFDGALNAETFLNFNVIYSLLIGLLVIRARHEIKILPLKYLAIAALFAMSCLGDWGYIAPLTILTFDVFYGNIKNQLFSFSLVTILRNGLLVTLLGPFLSFARWHAFDFSDWNRIVWYEFGVFIAIALITFYNGEKGRSSKFTKWGFYLFYPLHLLIIALIKIFA